MSRIQSNFAQIIKEDRIALMPFLMAGDPSLEITSGLLLRLQNEGADFIELGVPYSDPLADGPVIQASASRGLRAGTTMNSVLDLLEDIKGKLTIPIILFSYTNPIISIGFESFCDRAAKSGVSGLVIPDLPLEEAEKFSPIANSKDIDLILLVAPTTPNERMARIANASRGFIYLVSVTGVTGERTSMNQHVELMIQELLKVSTSPIAVGFGISTAEHITKVKDWGANGAIVGSAFVKRISKANLGSEVDEAALFCKELLKGNNS